MSLAPRRLALLSWAGLCAATTILAPAAAADPDIDSESATAVIQELQEQGYAVDINGVPSGDAALLTSCRVTAIHNPGNAAPNPAGDTRIAVDVACPIQRG